MGNVESFSSMTLTVQGNIPASMVKKGPYAVTSVVDDRVVFRDAVHTAALAVDHVFQTFHVDAWT